MKTIFTSLVLCFISIISSAQYVFKIKADSLLVTSDSNNVEFNLENSTKNLKGFLYNKGNGRTAFKRALIWLNDTTYEIGADTLHIRSGGGTGGNPTASLGLSAINGTASTFMRSDAAPALDQDITPAWTDKHIFNAAGIGQTVTDRIALGNPTAATASTQQFSPAIHFQGNGWGTTAGTSQAMEWRVYNSITSGTVPSHNLLFQHNIAGGGWVTMLTLPGSGTAAFNLSLSAGTITSSTQFILNRPNIANTSIDGYVINNSTNASSSIPVQYSPRIRFRGSGWNGSGSQIADFIQEVRPVSGTNPITSSWFLASQINGDGYVDRLQVRSDGGFVFPSTNTSAGTTGAATINKISGTVNIAAASTSIIVTNSLVSASSIVFAVCRTNDATAYIKSVVPAAGSFTIRLGAAATAETSIGFWVIN